MTHKNEMKHEEHRARHQLLHEYLDELTEDYFCQTRNLPSKSTITDLMEWSHKQINDPTGDA